MHSYVREREGEKGRRREEKERRRGVEREGEREKGVVEREGKGSTVANSYIQKHQQELQ